MKAENPEHYNTESLIRENSEEYRIIYDNHHFLSIVNNNGAFIMRPHPYDNPNSWGTSLYLQPFMPDGIITNARVNEPVSRIESVSISALGKLSDNDRHVGQWGIDMAVMFDELKSCVIGKGRYHIKLQESVHDLNLCKISSNYLTDVPLLSGSYGNTGDMLYARVIGDDFGFLWYPHLKKSHFPQDPTKNIDVLVTGNYNQVDTKTQGYKSIEPALKPMVNLIFESESNPSLFFGGIYSETKNKQFWADNVGIAILMRESPLKFSMNFSFLSCII